MPKPRYENKTPPSAPVQKREQKEEIKNEMRNRSRGEGKYRRSPRGRCIRRDAFCAFTEGKNIDGKPACRRAIDLFVYLGRRPADPLSGFGLCLSAYLQTPGNIRPLVAREKFRSRIQIIIHDKDEVFSKQERVTSFYPATGRKFLLLAGFRLV